MVKKEINSCAKFYHIYPYESLIAFSYAPDNRARPDWAYEFPDRTGPDTQICRTGPAGPD